MSPTPRVLALVCLALLATVALNRPTVASAGTDGAAVARPAAGARDTLKRPARKMRSACAAKRAAKRDPKHTANHRPRPPIRRCRALRPSTLPGTHPLPAPPPAASTSVGVASTTTGGGPDAPTALGAPPTPAIPAPAGPQGMYWGAWIGPNRTGTQPPWDMSAASLFEADAGKAMSLLQFSTPMAYGSGDTYFDFPAAEMNRVRDHGSIPFFSWSTHAMGDFADPAFRLRSIIDGHQDAAITAWATAARDWGQPFFLRFDWEMNGDWFPWGERYGSNQPGEYVAAWRHVHDIFTHVGATNATWVWCPATDRWNVLQPLRSLYPGGAYVDWTCLDGYNADDPWTSFTELFGSTYDAIVNEIAPDKPMVIGETGSTESGGDKAAWIRDMFDVLPTRFPRIRALLWFDDSEAGAFNHTDWPINSSPATAVAFADGVAPDRWRANRYRSWAGLGIVP